MWTFHVFTTLPICMASELDNFAFVCFDCFLYILLLVAPSQTSWGKSNIWPRKERSQSKNRFLTVDNENCIFVQFGAMRNSIIPILFSSISWVQTFDIVFLVEREEPIVLSLIKFLHYESSTLILYKEPSSPIFQSCHSVSESVRKASVTPVQISILCNI